MSAGTAGIVFVTFLAFLGGVFYYLFLRPHGIHTYMAREPHTGASVGSQHSHRASATPIPPQYRVPDDTVQDVEPETVTFYGWPSAVEYYADVAQIDAFINGGSLAIAEWLPKYRRVRM